MLSIKLQIEAIENDKIPNNISSGLYFLGLKRFNGFPFYIGTGGEGRSPLHKRFADTKEYFKKAKRTFFIFEEQDQVQDKYEASIQGFANFWTAKVQNGFDKRFIYIPNSQEYSKTEIQIVKDKSIRFWEEEITKYYFKVVDKQNQNFIKDKNILRAVEAYLQTETRKHLEDKRSEINLSILPSKTRSKYLGQTFQIHYDYFLKNLKLDEILGPNDCWLVKAAVQYIKSNSTV